MLRVGARLLALGIAAAPIAARAEPSVFADGSDWRLRTQAAALQSRAKPGPPRRSITLFGGPLVSARLGRVFEGNLDDGIAPAGFVGAAASREIARWGAFAIELEGGFGGLIGRRESVSTPQAWSAAFLRYDGFFWNDHIRTTVAASTGVNWSLRRSTAERTRLVRSSRLLHYLAPEITIAAPSQPDRELLLRLHHRSSVWGLFGCQRCALNVLTLGLRQRF